MGWKESPPYFCTATETARDIIQNLITDGTDNLDPHPLEAHMYIHPSGTLPPESPTATPAYTNTPTSNSLTQHALITKLIEVYVDDFIAGTNDLSKENLIGISRAILHGVHSIFPPPEISGHNGEDPVSFKKLVNGDGFWAFEKEILGWVFNDKAYTIQLPPEKVTKLIAKINEALKQPYLPLHDYQCLMGKLNHATIGIPNGRGLSAPIYHAMKNDPPTIPITQNLTTALKDWKTILQHTSKRPTHVKELTTGPADYTGYVDACKTGVGGVWFSNNTDFKPTVWRL